MKDKIAIVGEGRLADLVAESLSAERPVLRLGDAIRSDVPESVVFVVAVHDEYRPSAYQAINMALREAGIPWLSATVIADEGIVGPYVRPGEPGCPHCALKRRTTSSADDAKQLEMRMTLWKKGVVKRDPKVPPWGLRHMRDLIVAEARSALGRETPRTDGRIYLVDLCTLEGSRHVFLPDPFCPVCGRLPDDTPESARIDLKPRPKTDPRTFRVKSLTETDFSRLQEDYLDDRTGVMKEARLQLAHPFSDVLVLLPSAFGDEWTAGRSHAYPLSLASALLEGLERNCGTTPRGKKTVVRDSYRNLADMALNPTDVGLYSPEQYADEDFPFEPFDQDAPLTWVWGYSFMRESPILVPEGLVYYHAAFGGSLANEGSNGCALGGSLEEAVFHGVMEAVERDSFLMAWYARLPLPRLDPFSAGDRELGLMAERLIAVAGYELNLFNATTENGIPSIWALAKNKRRTGANLICAAGASLDPVRAAKSAVYELAGFTRFLSEQAEARREEILEMLGDSNRVEEMPHHALVYALPEAEERLRFLRNPERPVRNFADEFAERAPSPDLTEDLRGVLNRFRRLGLEVIVVDQTSAELSRNGLHCVKVLIPGLLPMTFGHRMRRVHGLDRLLKVPMALGYTDRPLTENELNPYPHPFL
ncbi:TOMM precursor leader peptide-binding protein [Cohnella caldifontis]|uniref:TOMM precursor leader peptide-binding protein n=1 Tax=Cohnella caldifontis TaxID=3027471 RepID=UPI0023EDB432|nr:TOMM precursor leader peptide-binding protein [Cohnella sp. YIM B05605]